MDEKYQEIISNTLNLFYKYGIRSLTIDDICRHLSISKKTIYKYISNKSDLVEKAINKSFEIMQKNILLYYDIKGNAIDKIISLSRHTIEECRNFNPIILFELKEYYAGIYDKFLSERKNLILGLCEDNIKQGISEDIYRSNIPIDLYAKINFYNSELFLNKELMQSLNNYSVTQISMALIDNSVRSVVNENGIKYYEQQILKIHQNNK